MTEKFRAIDVDHSPAIYAIEPTQIGVASEAPAPLQLTLLELVQAVGEVSNSEEEVVAATVEPVAALPTTAGSLPLLALVSLLLLGSGLLVRRNS